MFVPARLPFSTHPAGPAGETAGGSGHGRLRERPAPFQGQLLSGLRVRTVRPFTGVTA